MNLCFLSTVLEIRKEKWLAVTANQIASWFAVGQKWFALSHLSILTSIIARCLPDRSIYLTPKPHRNRTRNGWNTDKNRQDIDYLLLLTSDLMFTKSVGHSINKERENSRYNNSKYNKNLDILQSSCSLNSYMNQTVHVSFNKTTRRDVGLAAHNYCSDSFNVLSNWQLLSRHCV